MPPLPKRKYAKARQGDRRSHLAVEQPILAPRPRWCPHPGDCATPPTHMACPKCNMYDGRLLKGATTN